MDIKKILNDHKQWLYTGGQEGHRAVLMDVDLNDVDLSGSTLRYSKFVGVNLSGADLSHADLYKSTLIGCDLSNTKLHHTELIEAELIDINFSGADFHNTDISGAKLSTSPGLTIGSLLGPVRRLFR